MSDAQRDVSVSNQGTLWLFLVHTETAQEWVREHVQTDMDGVGRFMRFTAEHRYAPDIAEGMMAAGFNVHPI